MQYLAGMRRLLYGLMLLLLAVTVGCHERRSASSQAEPDISILTDTRAACVLSQLSYCSAKDSLLGIYLPGWKLAWESAGTGGNHAFVAVKGRQYAVIIRGSLMEFSWAAFENWITQDLNVINRKPWRYGQDSSRGFIAEGAWQGFQNLLAMHDQNSNESLVSFLENKTPKDAAILFTGHSLGGNLATVLAAYCNSRFLMDGHNAKKLNAITLAAPAAGDDFFSKDFDRCFPTAIRIENSNDIVPKFPCRSRLASLGDIYHASEVQVGYHGFSISLSKTFSLMNSGLDLFTNFTSDSDYIQTCGNGTLISVPTAGTNAHPDITEWFNEARYQHGIAQYAKALGAPVIDCSN